MNLFLRRVLIVGGLIISLVTLEVATEDSLLNGLPDYQEILQGIEDKQEQEKEIDDYLENITKEDQQDSYDSLFDYRVRHTFIIEFTQLEWNGLISDMQEYYDEFG